MRSTVVASLGLRLDAAEQRWAADLDSWLAEHWPVHRDAIRSSAGADREAALRSWQAELAQARYAAIGWPEEHGGRAASTTQQLLYYLALGQHRAAPATGRIGLNLCGPTLIAHGTPEQQQRFLPPMLRGEHLWCQGFSEPDAGSDLASLRTKGVVVGDELVITGQKIWTSGAERADWMFALVRTDPAAPKRDGISFVLVPMDADGVDVRPIKQISGDSGFSEVFLDEVRVPLAHVVGGLGNGWSVTRTTLANERAVLFLGQQVALTSTVRRIIGQAKEVVPGRGRAADDRALRDRIAEAWIETELVRINGMRNLAKVLDGQNPGPEGAMSKLFGQHVEQQVHELALDVGGGAAVLERGAEGAPYDGKWALGWLRTRASTIGGGTSEIQRNILAERVLGMPRDPWADA